MYPTARTDTPVVKLTTAVIQSIGANFSLLDLPKSCSNSAVRGHSIREPSHPRGNHFSMVMRSAKRWKTRPRTASQNAHHTGMGRPTMALEKPLNCLPGRSRLGQWTCT